MTARFLPFLLVVGGLLASPSAASADDADPRAEVPPLKLEGYVEAFGQWNFNEPINGITSLRGFDNRHNTFTLSNAALDAQWTDRNVIGRLALQVGHTPSTYYLSEPALVGTSSVNATGSELWKYVQQAYAGYRFGGERGVALVAGIFLSPIGPETIPVRDNWNWSRSTLFFGLPFYHTGIRATVTLSESVALTLAGYNGWNSVVDNNRGKSLSAELSVSRPRWSLSALYLGGPERSDDAPEGRGWRHLFDGHATWAPARWCALRAHVDGGFESTTFGWTHWVASAIYARFRLLEDLHLAVRGDVLQESVASNHRGRASAIFGPAPWIGSRTATLEYRLRDRVSFRIEGRRDDAGALVYFGKDAPEGLNGRVPNRRSQATLTFGVTSWF